VFNGSSASFPCAIFSDVHRAESWIRKHGVAGVLSKLFIDDPAWDRAVRLGNFQPMLPLDFDARARSNYVSNEITFYYRMNPFDMRFRSVMPLTMRRSAATQAAKRKGRTPPVRAVSLWMFNGVRSRVPSGVFSTLKRAERWIHEHELPGTLTEMYLDDPAYDRAVRRGRYVPKRQSEHTPLLKQRFSSPDMHYHYYLDSLDPP
jgi:hypothetical protein